MVMTLVAIGTFILGLVLGALGGVYYLKQKMSNMKMSDQDIQQMARNMGMNLNQKQLMQVSKRMQNMNSKGMPGAGKPKKKK
ncbi:YneF family protein [Tumebacillus sp. DT12]|uniref:YneF family protein n=1 Tax=Tumebacillus lacus TaxID=2995335 RepID=A0ABT3WYZ3_9BACL|nr:YneF family protein [Tumebacillus lacus]MCX7568480.1 YneF family protein [Tumebacillus lacus]